jgi:large subunit ribosomal protein L21
MYAIIQTGGKQYKIEEGTILDVELLEAGDKGYIEFNEILLLSDGSKIIVGNPHVKNCIVTAEVIKETKGPKVFSYTYLVRKNHHKKKGHRQKYSKIKITKIQIS